MSRGERIRTSDILLPKQARYRTALRPAATPRSHRDICKTRHFFYAISWAKGKDVIDGSGRATGGGLQV